jgi:hypothetical protein
MMHKIGKPINRRFFVRSSGILVLIVALSVAGIVMAAASIDNDEFSGSSLNTSIWSVTHTEGGATIGVSGGALQLQVPSGSSFTFSNTNTKSPRVLQAINDDDFYVEVKFNSSMSVYQDDKIQGILVYDQGANQWLRFDFNTDSDSLNTYVGHLSSTGVLTHIENVSPISASGINVPLYMRVQYVKSTGTWTFSYRIGDAGDFTVKKTFTEATAFGASGFSFAPTHIGLFAGSTGDTNPGHTASVDYFRNVGAVEPPPNLTEKLYLPVIAR